MRQVYLDNVATNPLPPEVRQVMIPYPGKVLVIRPLFTTGETRHGRLPELTNIYGELLELI